LDATIEGERLRYPLIATPVAIEYEPDTSTVTVVPQGPPRLQSDALADVDNRRVRDLLELANASGQVPVDPWDAAERREFAGRALRRLGFDPKLCEPGAPGVSGPHVVDTGVLFVRPRQRMVRRFLADMRGHPRPGTRGPLGGQAERRTGAGRGGAFRRGGPAAHGGRAGVAHVRAGRGTGDRERGRCLAAPARSGLGPDPRPGPGRHAATAG